jgi:hypothetical protein
MLAIAFPVGCQAAGARFEPYGRAAGRSRFAVVGTWREVILRRVPFFVRSPLRQMLGGTGTQTYANFRARRTTYFMATATKARE